MNTGTQFDHHGYGSFPLRPVAMLVAFLALAGFQSTSLANGESSLWKVGDPLSAEKLEAVTPRLDGAVVASHEVDPDFEQLQFAFAPSGRDNGPSQRIWGGV